MSAAQDRFDAQDEFFVAEGFREVVISTGFESGDAVLGLALSREEYDGHLRVRQPYVFRQAESILARQHHIQYAQVVGVLVELAQPFLTVSAEVYVEAFPLQGVLDNEAEVLVVFHQEDVRFLFVHGRCH